MSELDTRGLVLPAWGLLSKWGFNDGDAPDAYLDWLDDRRLLLPDNWHEVLRILVRTRLMPHVREEVELVDVNTIHNPIRAKTVNGRPIDDAADNDGLLIDVAVNIPFAEVYEIQSGGVK